LIKSDLYLDLLESIRTQIRGLVKEKYQVELEKVSAEVPPRTEMGDLAFPIAFELAKRIKETTGQKVQPRLIAEEIKSQLEKSEAIERVEVAGPGYLNLFYQRARFLSQLSEDRITDSGGYENKIIVEHTNINPNKAAHIGHLRNAVLGDSFVHLLRASGNYVEVQNYIDNTGVQVADVVVGFIHIENMTLNDVKALSQSDQKFDYYCWDLYSKVGLFYRDGEIDGRENPEKLKLRYQTLHQIEEGKNDVAALADFVATQIVHCHLNTMERLLIKYDVLPRESDILHLKFWDRAFEQLKANQTIRFEAEGKNAGCWVMPTDFHTGTEEHEADKILVRSNGTVTYAGKDIAYQLWKLGLLGLDFNYKLFKTYGDGHMVWVTTSESESDTRVKGFGKGSKVYNVIDSRQSYTQEVVKRGVSSLHKEIDDNSSIHLAYEMVALSPAACIELGIELSEEDKTRPFIEMSGRKGLGVKADDLIDRLGINAQSEVRQRHPELSEDEQIEIARQISVGALRYFLLKWTRNTIIAFDFKEALSFEGETGPYCQYAAVRANSIFRKLDQGAILEAQQFVAAHENRSVVAAVLNNDSDDLWSLVLLSARLNESIAQAAGFAEPAHMAKYLFSLARSFNFFYHKYRILNEEDKARRSVLILIANIARKQLTRGLQVLGIDVPERM
jgi:arginyl-tRNA synthetase